MTPIHEIAFLVLSGALSCWTLPPDSPCTQGQNLKLAAYEKPDLDTKPKTSIDRASFAQYEGGEAGYEENGFAVFKTEGADWYQVKSRAGERLWLHLPTVQKQFQFGWSPIKIENLFAHGIVRVADEYPHYLRQEDLKTPLQIPKNVFARIQERQLQPVLREMKIELPAAYIDVSLACTSVDSTPGLRIGSCAAPPHVMAFKNREANSPGADISLSWANWAGKPAEETPTGRSAERLYIFKQDKDWVQIHVVFGAEQERMRWIKKAALASYKIQTLPPETRISALAQVLQASGRSSDAGKLRNLNFEPGFATTGKTKWSTDGVLWAEVEIQDLPECSQGEPKMLMKAWLPYKPAENSAPILGWYSRGC